MPTRIYIYINTQVIEYLVDYARVDVNQRDDSNHTALSWCVCGALACVLSMRPRLGESARSLSFSKPHTSQPPQPNPAHPHTHQNRTCYFPDNAASVALLLHKGADPTIATHDGRTPLMIAAYAGYVRVYVHRFDRR